MTTKRDAFRQLQSTRLAQYLRLCEEVGVEQARERCLEGYPERQRSKMGPLIEGRSLFAGFELAVPRFAEIGVREEVIDDSDETTDAVLEIAATCMCCDASTDIGLAQPVSALCELDFEATRRAFSDISVTTLRRQVDGACVCIFRYARRRRPGPDRP
jgi:hypothetical protein